jgi:phospholipid transport system substrate-binding protein
LLTATPVIATLLWALWRRFRYTLISLTTLFVGALGTAAVSIAADIPFHFANRVLLCALALLGGLAGTSGAEPGDAAARPEGAAAARTVVESFHTALLGTMQDADALGFQGRYERMLAALDQAFDLPFMARTSLGATWKELDETQRAEFLALSRRLSAARYADNFDGFEGQRFDTHSERPAARGTIFVETELVQPKDRDVRFDYRLREVGNRWRIIDILLDGQISDLVLWRGQYRSVIEREGFEALVETLEERIEKLSRD